MQQNHNNIKSVSGFVVVAAFGLLTLSSSFADHSSSTAYITPYTYIQNRNALDKTEMDICLSSALSNRAVGDIVKTEYEDGMIQQHKKLAVNLTIVKMERHISNFDFEEEFEEI